MGSGPNPDPTTAAVVATSVLTLTCQAHTNLSGASAGTANISGAIMNSANLTGANLSNAVLTGAILEFIVYSPDTVCPSGQQVRSGPDPTAANSGTASDFRGACGL